MRLSPPSWWYDAPLPLAAWALWPISALYGRAVIARFARTKPYRSKLPVICIGNFTMGGAGKTPVAIAVARLLSEAGRRPGFLTRGYGGSVRGPRLVNPEADSFEAVGDEALLLAQTAPTVVSRDRPAGATALEKLGIDAIIMDDGFQNPTLHKDLSLIVIDGGARLGSGRVFPMGPLRAPLAFQARRADAVIVAGGRPAGDLPAGLKALPILAAQIVPDASLHLEDQRVVAFCGIGRPAKFFETLKAVGAEIVRTFAFPDHHPFTEGEAATLLRAAEETGALLITTEKDRVRLGTSEGARRALYDASKALSISVRFLGEAEAHLADLIGERLGLN